ncbi:MAG TPA: SDR family NAD(P)-dependent oxidoreductase [Hyphomicrobiaceae bacterium]|nr:SDR family NAD(P)-dependent oxidoreductase [Hyphomicrobiaceae bacterium]
MAFIDSDAGRARHAARAGEPLGRRPVVLVTGGSRGIGLALARGFAARGHELVLVARNARDLERAAAAIRAEHAVAVTPLPFDLTGEGAARGVLAAIDAVGGYVDTLVNCAGVGASGAFAESAADEVRGAIGVNIEAATTLMQACLPGMVARGRGGVLNVASLAGLLPMPRLALYGATKSYLVALSRAVASELAGSGVTVSVLLPGPVDTSFFPRNLSAVAGHTSLLPGLSPDTIAEIAIGGYLARQTVITPGMLAALCRVGLKLLPARMLSSLVHRTLGAASAGSSQVLALSAPQRAAAADPCPETRRGRLWRLMLQNGPTLVLAVLALVYLVLVGLELRKAPYVDPSRQGYIGVAAGLLEYGVYSKVFVSDSAELVPGRYLAPAYPAIIAGLALVDPRLADGVRCLVGHGHDCLQGNPFRLLVLLQALAGLAALGCAYLLARELSGSSGLGALAAVLVLIMGRYNDYAALVMPYGILPVFALGLCLTMLLAHRRRSLAMAATGGMLTGALALLEACYAALWLAVPLLLLSAESARERQSRSWSFALLAGLTFAVAAGLVVGPWMLRNYLLFGDVALVDGGAIEHFGERVAYVGLRGRDLAVAAFVWLPAVGDLSLAFLPRSTTVRFDVYYDGSLLREAGTILAATTPPPGGPSHLAVLVEKYVLGDPLGYAMSTVLLVERGMRSASGFFVFWGWLTLPVLVRRLRAQQDLGPFLMAAGPLLAMVVVQALLTANVAWMNLPLVFVYAYAIVKVTGGLELPFAVRRLFGGERDAGPRDTTADTPLAP